MNSIRKAPTLAALGLGMLVLASIGGCVNRAAQEQSKKTEALVRDTTVPVRTAKATARDLPEIVDVSGAITTSEEAAVGPAVPGRLIAVYVKDGDQVSPGQAIAQQETQNSSAQLRQAQAQVASARSALDQARTDAVTTPQKTSAGLRAAEARLAQARSQLEKAQRGARDEERSQAEWAVRRSKSDLDTAKAALDRANRLFGEGAIALVEVEAAQNRYDNALTAYESALQSQMLVNNATRPEDLASARQEVRAAEEAVRIARADRSNDQLARDRVRSAQANLDAALQSVTLAQKALSDATVRSPFGGRVSGRPLQPGTYVAPGAVIATIVGGDGQYFEANVAETSIRRIEPGASVDVSLTALPDVRLTGSVIAINPQASGPGRLFTVRIGFTERLAQVKSGMFARGKILAGVRRGAVVVPIDAVVRDGERAYLFVVADGAAVRRDVKLGIEGEGVVEANGVRLGEDVVVSGQTGLTEGTKVRIETGAPATGQKGA